MSSSLLSESDGGNTRPGEAAFLLRGDAVPEGVDALLPGRGLGFGVCVPSREMGREEPFVMALEDFCNRATGDCSDDVPGLTTTFFLTVTVETWAGRAGLDAPKNDCIRVRWLQVGRPR